MEVKKGSTDITVYFHLRDSSDGTSKTGLAYNSPGAVASYVRDKAARTAITLATQTPSGAHTDGGFVEVDGTNAKGLYRLDIPDAAVVTGVDKVIIHIGFTGVFEESLQIDLVDNTAKDVYDRLGAPAGASVSADIATVDGNVDAIKAKTDNLPQGVKKNTALNNFEFLMVDSTDHVTPKTGLTVTAQRSIDGAAFGACANSVTEVSNGIYKINLAASDLNGDVITLRFTATGADATLITIKTNA